MASPHTAGVAALVRQAHPDWKKVEYWKAAIVNTADPALVNGYATRLDGSGFVQAPPARPDPGRRLGDTGTASLNFGFAELGKDFHDESSTSRCRNFGNSAVTFNIGDGARRRRPALRLH